MKQKSPIPASTNSVVRFGFWALYSLFLRNRMLYLLPTFLEIKRLYSRPACFMALAACFLVRNHKTRSNGSRTILHYGELHIIFARPMAAFAGNTLFDWDLF